MPRELAIWPRLRHPNVIRFLDYFEDNQRVYMVMSVHTVSTYSQVAVGATEILIVECRPQTF